MKIWKHDVLDSLLFTLSIIQLIFMIFSAFYWQDFSFLLKVAHFIFLIFMITYNRVVVSHSFSHTPWFESDGLNRFLSMLNSINSGQSVQTHQLFHIRNHHRYNNDQKGLDSKTLDFSSTYLNGKNGEHVSLFYYVFFGTISLLKKSLMELLSIIDFFCVTPRELNLRSHAPNAKELRQIQLDRMVRFLAIFVLLIISWKWTIFIYIPSFYVALLLVNIQNYYEHFGANPSDNMANSVSYYGRVYNLLTFNDGYHQEHHLYPEAHWRVMPLVRERHKERLAAVKRIISPMPAILGFLDFKRTVKS